MTVFSESNLKFEWFVRNVASKPLWLTLFFLPIPFIGLVLEYLCIREAFSRSGSILVCVAIFCVYLNHFLSVEANNVQGALRAATDLGPTYEDKFRSINPEIQGDNRERAARSLQDIQNKAEAALPELRDTQERLVMVEFLAGIFGTLVWGFGGLVEFVKCMCQST